MTKDVSATPDQDGEKTELKRVMGPGLLLLFVVGDVLGTGIYALTGEVAAKVGGIVWLPFLVAFVLATVTACSYLELVTKYPKAAGAALYTQKAFGVHFLTFLVAFAVMSSGITSASTASQAFAENFGKSFGLGDGAFLITAISIGFMVLLGLINLRGVGESVKANVVLTCIELTGLLIIHREGVMHPGDPIVLVAAAGTALAIALAVLVHAVAMTTEHTGDLARRGETELGAREHRCRESHRARVCCAAGEDRSGGIEKGEHTVTVSGSEVLADHLGVVGKQGHAVLEFHKSPPSTINYIARGRPMSRAFWPSDTSRLLASAYSHAARTTICHLSQDQKPRQHSPPMSGALNLCKCSALSAIR